MLANVYGIGIIMYDFVLCNNVVLAAAAFAGGPDGYRKISRPPEKKR